MFPIRWWNLSRQMFFKTKPLYRKISSILKVTRRHARRFAHLGGLWCGPRTASVSYVVGEGQDSVPCIPQFLSRWAVFQPSTAHAAKVPKSAKSDSLGCAQAQVDLHPSICKEVSGKSPGTGVPLMYPCNEASLPVLSTDGYWATKIFF